MQQSVEELFRRVALAGGSAPLDRESLDRIVKDCGFAEEDARTLRDGYERLAVYRSLVRETLRDALHLAVPRSVRRLGEHFEKYFDRFLAERSPRSHYLRDVTAEFIDFCEGAFRDQPEVPVYTLDLMRHEALRIQIAAAPGAEVADGGAALDVSRGVRFTEASRVMRYAHAVHELSDDEDDLRVPEARRTTLFVYRSPDDEVRYLELTPLAADILERLRDRGESLGAAVTGACSAQALPLDEAVLAGTARLLADLAERGALLGPEPGCLNGEATRMKIGSSGQ